MDEFAELFAGPPTIGPERWNTAEVRDLLQRSTDVLATLLPGARCYLTDVLVVPDEQMPWNISARYGLAVSPAATCLADIHLTMRLRESTVQLLTDQIHGRVPTDMTARVRHRLDAREAAETLLHELLHSCSALEGLDFIFDLKAAMSEPVIRNAAEAVTALTVAQLREAWLRATGLERTDASLLDPALPPPRVISIDGQGDVQVVFSPYEPMRGYLGELVESVAQGDEAQRAALIRDLATGAQASALNTVAVAMLSQHGVAAPNASDQRMATHIVSGGLSKAREALPAVSRTLGRELAIVRATVKASATRPTAVPCDIEAALSARLFGEAAKQGTRLATRALRDVADMKVPAAPGVVGALTHLARRSRRVIAEAFVE